MSFAFEIKRAVQMSAYLIKRAGGQEMDYLKLLKLLYWADRESLREAGFPLTGDAAYAMEHGPALSSIYNLIVPRPGYQRPVGERDVWNRHLQREGYKLKLLQDPGTGELSRYDRRILDRIYEEHGEVDGFELSHLSHDFPEWQKNWYAPDKGKRGSMQISIEDQLDALGMSSRAKAIREQAEEDRAFHRAHGQ